MKKICLQAGTLLLICILLLPQTVFGSFTEMPNLSLEKCKKAEITLGDTVKGSMLELVDGGSKDLSLLTYNRPAVYAGRQCREVTSSNQMTFRFSEDFADAEDDTFLFVFHYWDYAGAGLFYLDYASWDEAGKATRINVYKRGTPSEGGHWRTEYAIVTGASFTRSLTDNADFKIANRANNAFSKIEVYNLTPIKDEIAQLELGIYGTEKVKILFNIGLFSAESSNDAAAKLSEKLTREQAIDYTVTFLGLRKDAEAANLSCPYGDVAEDYRSTVAYAEQIGIFKKDGEKLNAQEIIKEREIIEYYLRYFKLNTEGDVVSTAKENRLIRASDYICQPGKEALVDHAVCLGYNALKMTVPEEGKSVYKSMLNKGIISFQDIIRSGDAEFVESIVSEPLYCPPEEHIDKWTGRKWYCLNFFDNSIMRSYFTQQSWCTDNERFIFCDYNGMIYEYNTKTYMVKKIADLKYKYTSMNIANGTDNFYWVNTDNELMKMDLTTYEQTKLYGFSKAFVQVSDLSVSKDQTRICMNVKYNDPEAPGINRTVVYDTEKEELYMLPYHDFDSILGQGFYEMHSQVNPCYKDLILYCSGGAYTGPEPKRSYLRCWCHNMATGEEGLYFKEYPAGYTPLGLQYGEQNCHETWSADGEWLVMNKATTQYEGKEYQVGHAGIVLMNKNGRDRNYVGSAYLEHEGVRYKTSFTHPGISPVTSRWVVADTNPTMFFNRWNAPVFLIDTQSGRMQVIGNFPETGTSDFHNHPSMSQDGNKVIFGVSEVKTLGKIGWMDVSDLVNVPPDGRRVQLSDSCEALDYQDFEYDLDEIEVDGETAYRIRHGKKMYLNVINDVVWGRKKDVTLSVTYLDNGLTPIKLEYLLWNDNRVTNYLSWHQATIKREGTGGFKTKEITLRGVNMDNMGLLSTEMKISGMGSDIVIKEITARESEKE